MIYFSKRLIIHTSQPFIFRPPVVQAGLIILLVLPPLHDAATKCSARIKKAVKDTIASVITGCCKIKCQIRPAFSSSNSMGSLDGATDREGQKDRPGSLIRFSIDSSQLRARVLEFVCLEEDEVWRQSPITAI